MPSPNIHSDTPPEIQELHMSLIQSLPAWRKLEMVCQLRQAVLELAMAGIRSRYPDDSPEVCRRRLADLVLGAELAEKVYGRLSE